MILTDIAARRVRLGARCPHCRAPIGARCVVVSSGRPLSGDAVHPSRVEALAEQLRGGAA